MNEKHHVVIIGGGFGGLYAAKALKRAPVKITLLDRHNYHLFQPLIYQVATGFLSAADVASPLRTELNKQKNVQVIMAEVMDFDVESHKVILKDEKIAYDTLILAAGASHSYFGHPEWEKFAPGLKSIDDALDAQRRIFLAFENAERTADVDSRQVWLTFVIVGGGPTGVEVAGALGETVQHTIRTDYRAIDPSHVRILLLEAGDRLLPAYPPGLSLKATRALEKLGVTVRTGNLVTKVERDEVEVRIGKKFENIAAGTILWAAGVQASPLGHKLKDRTHTELDKAGRLIVEPDLTLPGHPEIFVIGEIAASPLRASTEQLKGLPTALIITAQADVLRDEDEAYANKLRRAGVRVTAVRFQGTIHDFIILNALKDTTAARGTMALTTAWLWEGFSTDE